jgi:hypothetical protein
MEQFRSGMAEAVETAPGRGGGVAFELDRFEMADGDRFEVNGRWFGVRGRRFIRPSLTLVADEEQCRLLADLEHKPWSAEDGQPWKAAFPYDPQESGWLEAELNVAPDITVSLPLPEAARGSPGNRRGHRARRTGASAGQHVAPPRRRQRHADLAGDGDIRASRGETPVLPNLARETARLQRQLADMVAARDRALADHEAAVQGREHAAGEVLAALAARDQAIADRDAAAQERDRATDERDAAVSERHRAAGEATRSLHGRDQAIAERDQAIADRDHAIAERDAAREAAQRAQGGAREAIDAAFRVRDQAIAEREAAVQGHREADAEVDAALQARDRAEADRDAALRARDEANRLRTAAVAAGEVTAGERDALKAALEQLRAERDEAVTSHGAALVMRNAANTPPSFRRESNRVLHFLPAFVVIAVAVLALVLTHVI